MERSLRVMVQSAAILITIIPLIDFKATANVHVIRTRCECVEQRLDDPVKGARFSLTPSSENAGDFNVLLTDGNEKVISGQLFIGQLYNMRDLMVEARKFALNDDAIGKQEPITTRFSSKEDRSLSVDVAKTQQRSRFYVTLRTAIGEITAEGGSVNRLNRREEGLFFEILDRVETLIAKSTGQTAK